MRCGYLPASLITVSLACTSSAWADPTPAQRATSDVLFADAKALVKAGQYNEACPKFVESQRIYPTPGTLLNIGDCYENSTPPRLASAWGAYKQAEIAARGKKDTDREEEAVRRWNAVKPRLASVTIRVAPSSRVDGLQVRWAGEAAGEGLWGTAVPVDPGEYTVEAEAPGRKSWTGKVIVGSNPGTTTVDVPVLLPAPDAPTDALAPVSTTQRTVGIVVSGVGVVGVVLGAVFGVKTLGKTSDAKPHCSAGEPAQCDPTGLQLESSAKSTGAVSTVAFLVGGAALVGGVVLFATAPKSADKNTTGALRITATPMIGSTTAAISLHGEW
jgi:serine/threonine-protein kinase